MRDEVKKVLILRRIIALRRRLSFRRRIKTLTQIHMRNVVKQVNVVSEVLGLYKPRVRTIGSLERSERTWLILLEADENRFREAFRVSKTLFHEICDAVRDQLEPLPNFISTKIPCSVEKQVGMTLYKLASCGEYRAVGDVFGVHKSTVHKHFYRVIKAINSTLMKPFIKMPNDQACEIISTRFKAICGIPQIIGCIDGSHIPILAPSEGRKDFVNRKSWTSLVLQAVVDDSCKFIDVSCKFPGSCHDSAVFKGSNLFKVIDEIIPKKEETINGVKIPYFIIGDPAYELKPYMMKDYPGRGLSKEKDLFNKTLNSARVKVEMAFGRLKGRWRLLLKRSDIDYTFMPQVIVACCVLHNMIESRKEVFPPQWILTAEDFEDIQPETEVLETRFVSYAGSAIRDALCAFVNRTNRQNN